MRLIDIDAFRKEHRMNEHCEDCERNARECQYNDFSMMDFCGWLDDAPTVDAVPLDKLCEWLDEYMTAPGVDVYEVPKNHQKNRIAWKTWLAEKMDEA